MICYLPKFGMDANARRFKGKDMLLLRRLSATSSFKVSNELSIMTPNSPSCIPNDEDVNSVGRRSPVINVLDRSKISGATTQRL